MNKKELTSDEKRNILSKEGTYTKEELYLLSDLIVDDLYLRYLIENNLIKPEDVTKPWVTRHLKRPLQVLDTTNTLYQAYVNANKDNLKGVATYIADKDRVILHEELIELIDDFANGLLEYGIGPDSRVGNIVIGSYEEPMCLLSPNKNGSVVKYLDVLKIENLGHDIENSNLDVLLMDEEFLPLEPMVNPKNIPVIVLNATKDYTNTKYLSFEKVLALGASKPRKKAYIGSCDDKSLIINSSGTTGPAKPIAHSNKTTLSSVQRKMFIDLSMGRGNFVYKAIPSHLGYGSINTMYSGLISGTGVIIRKFVPEEMFEFSVKLLHEFKDIIKRHNLNEDALLLFFTSPMFFKYIFEKENLKDIKDLSFLGTVLGAGAATTKEEVETYDKELEERNCSITILNGFGSNEFLGPITCCSNSHNLFGSTGFPVIGTNVRIVDRKTLETLPSNTVGKILVESDSRCIGYEGMPEKTKKAIKVTPDGKEMFDTRDLAYFDENGFMHFVGREERVLVRNDTKNNIEGIENKIKHNEIVRECAMIATEDDVIDSIAYIVIDDKYKNEDASELINRIQAESHLSVFEMPAKFEIVETIPFTGSGKIDYQKLQQMRKDVSLALRRQ